VWIYSLHVIFFTQIAVLCIIFEHNSESLATFFRNPIIRTTTIYRVIQIITCFTIMIISEFGIKEAIVIQIVIFDVFFIVANSVLLDKKEINAEFEDNINIYYMCPY